MSLLAYPITLTPDSNGALLGGFVDFPECNFVGRSEKEAISEAIDALRTVIEMYILEGKQIPIPSDISTQFAVSPF